MEAMQFAFFIQAKNKSTYKSTSGAYAESIDRFGVHKTTVPQPTQISKREMEEIREKGPCFGCNKKW
jgi:hypothetical protein